MRPTVYSSPGVGVEESIYSKSALYTSASIYKEWEDPQEYDYTNVPPGSLFPDRIPMDLVAYSNAAELGESTIENVTENVTYENEIVSFADSTIENVTDNVTYENEIVSFTEEDPE